MSGSDSVFAFALTMTGNASGIDTSTNSENLNFGGTNFPLPLTSGAVPSVFFGAVSDSALNLALMDESQTDGDFGLLYSDFRFATATAMPEPGTGLLLSIGLVGIAAAQRRAAGR
jgi:hypothetical protein